MGKELVNEEIINELKKEIMSQLSNAHNIDQLLTAISDLLLTKKGDWVVTSLLYAILGTTVIHEDFDNLTTFVMSDSVNIIREYTSITKFDSEALTLFYDHKINRIYAIHLRNGYYNEYYINN